MPRKISKVTVKKIIAALDTNVNRNTIANIYKVSPTTISRIKLNPEKWLSMRELESMGYVPPEVKPEVKYVPVADLVSSTYKVNNIEFTIIPKEKKLIIPDMSGLLDYLSDEYTIETVNNLKTFIDSLNDIIEVYKSKC